ncbi:hypothetical protein ANN_00370 [Periplaneta americana]|uniref:Uncharacterized protein n=1 Tax=Periplaneta americana TaxID=6978 RepID=A0ABQ8TQK8_PERAM|nr:hypothetical protein ANN_00370 [Periplaneta americana]
MSKRKVFKLEDRVNISTDIERGLTQTGINNNFRRKCFPEPFRLYGAFPESYSSFTSSFSLSNIRFHTEWTWRTVKDSVYQNILTTPDDMQQRIRHACASIQPAACRTCHTVFWGTPSNQEYLRNFPLLMNISTSQRFEVPTLHSCHNPDDLRNYAVKLTGFLEFGKDAATLPSRGFDGHLSILLNEGCDWLLKEKTRFPSQRVKVDAHWHEPTGTERTGNILRETYACILNAEFPMTIGCIRMSSLVFGEKCVGCSQYFPTQHVLTTCRLYRNIPSSERQSFRGRRTAVDFRSGRFVPVSVNLKPAIC